jgi:hypothetical protein
MGASPSSSLPYLHQICKFVHTFISKSVHEFSLIYVNTHFVLIKGSSQESIAMVVSNYRIIIVPFQV